MICYHHEGGYDDVHDRGKKGGTRQFINNGGVSLDGEMKALKGDESVKKETRDKKTLRSVDYFRLDFAVSIYV